MTLKDHKCLLKNVLIMLLSSVIIVFLSTYTSEDQKEEKEDGEIELVVETAESESYAKTVILPQNKGTNKRYIPLSIDVDNLFHEFLLTKKLLRGISLLYCQLRIGLFQAASNFSIGSNLK